MFFLDFVCFFWFCLVFFVYVEVLLMVVSCICSVRVVVYLSCKKSFWFFLFFAMFRDIKRDWLDRLFVLLCILLRYVGF